MKKQILSMLLAIMMVVGLLPGVSITASAAKSKSFLQSDTAISLTNVVQSPIYVDGINGDDANDGLTTQVPVKTLTKAIELAGKNGTIIVMTTAYITPDTMGSGTVTLENLTIERWASNNTNDLLRIQGSSETSTMQVMLKNITIDGKDVATTNTFLALIQVNDYGELFIEDGAKLINQNGIAVYITKSTAKASMTGGEISGNTTIEASPACPGVYVSNGVFEMSDGLITGNTNTFFFGGGVYVNYGTFEMSGGIITDNYAHSGGGGVAVNEGKFTISDGEITNNVADYNNIAGHGNETTYGGGVYAYDLYGTNTEEVTIVISGGEISGNNASMGDGMSVMSTSTNTSVSISGSPKIVEEIDIGPASTAKPVKVIGDFTPVGKITLNLWGASAGSTIAVYDEGLTANADAFACYTSDLSAALDGQNVILKDGYAVTVENGNGDGYYAENEIVTIYADVPETGKKFAGWTSEDGVVFADSKSAETTFTMPDKAVTVTATYADLLPGKVIVNGVDLVNGDDDHTIDCGGGTAVYDPDTKTLTLSDATIDNSSGDGIEVKDIDITIHGVDTDADGSNQISGSTNAIKSDGNITITGKLGDITGGSNGGIYSTGGDILITEGAVVGNITSDWYTVQTDKGSITIDGTVGDITGVIAITSENNHDTIINGNISSITGTEYGIFAYKDVIIDEDAKIGDVSGGLGGIMAIADLIIRGKVDNISGGTHGIYAQNNNVTITGQVSGVSGQCAIRAVSGDIDISGIVGAVTGNGGSNNISSSYGIRADAGKIKISSVIGLVSASSDGTDVTIMALMAKNGIELAENTVIKTPKNNKIDLYNNSYYTVYNTAGTDDTGDDIPAATVEFEFIYNITVDTDGGTVTVTPTNPSEGDPVTITITPDEGKEVDTVTVTDRNNDPIVVTENEDGTYTYTQPAGDVTIAVTFKDTFKEPESSFDYDLWYYSLMLLFNQEYRITATATDGGTITPAGVAKVKYDKNITYTITPDNGYMITDVIVDGKSIGTVSEYTFKRVKKDHTITAIFAEIPWQNPYSDVSENDWFYEDVAFVSENNLMIGTVENEIFAPDMTATRAMIVTILWRLEGEPVVNYLMQFEDVVQDEWYSEAVRWAAANGIVLGYDDGLFRPEKAITREQLAAILHRYAAYKGMDNGAIFPMIPQYNYSLWAENDILWADMVGLTEDIGADLYDMTAYANRAEIAAYLRRFRERIF